jgi:hypothetical protein
MNVVSLLIYCSLSLFPSHGHGHSSYRDRGDVPHVATDASSVVIQSSRDFFFPDDQGAGTLGASLWEEDDSLEDGIVGAGILPSGSLRDLGWDDVTSLADWQHDPLRTPSYSQPLRC